MPELTAPSNLRNPIPALRSDVVSSPSLPPCSRASKRDIFKALLYPPVSHDRQGVPTRVDQEIASPFRLRDDTDHLLGRLFRREWGRRGAAARDQEKRQDRLKRLRSSHYSPKGKTNHREAKPRHDTKSTSPNSSGIVKRKGPDLMKRT